MANLFSSHYIECFRRTCVSALFSAPRDLVFATTEENLREALEKARVRDLRALPVKDTTTNQYTGFLDFIDVLAYLVDLVQSSTTPAETLLTSAEFSEIFLSAKVKDVANYSKRNPFLPVNCTATVYDVAIKLEEGAKRVPVLGEDGTTIVNIVSHSDVMHLMNSERAHDNVLQMTLGDLGIVSNSTVISVTDSQRAIDAFLLMASKRISALPILDEDGELVSVISIRDLKAASEAGSLETLLLPVVEFIALERRHAKTKTMYPYISCKETSTVENVIKRLEATRVHRLVVKHAEGHLKGVLSVEDIISFFVRNSP